MTDIPARHRCNVQRQTTWLGVADQVVRAVGQLLVHVDPDTTDLPPGLVDAVNAYLHPPDQTRSVADPLAPWTTDEPDRLSAPIDGVTVANQLHAALWRLAIDGLTFSPSRGSEDLEGIR